MSHFCRSHFQRLFHFRLHICSLSGARFAYSFMVLQGDVATVKEVPAGNYLFDLYAFLMGLIIILFLLKLILVKYWFILLAFSL